MGLNKNIFATLFPFVQRTPSSNDFDLASILEQSKVPLGNDLPENGGITGNYRYEPDDPEYSDDASPAGEQRFKSRPSNVPTQEAPVVAPPATSWPGPSPSVQQPTGIVNAHRRQSNPTNYDEAQADYQAAAAAPIQHQNPWVNGLYLALQGANKFFNPRDEAPITGLGEQKHINEVNRAGRRLAPFQQIEEQRQQNIEKQKRNQLLDAQIKTIPIDDENKRVQIDNQKAYAEERVQVNATKALTRLPHYDPNNAAHVRLAQQAGVDPATLQGWDDRKPDTKQVAGITYQYDFATKSFKPSNLPADESKTLTDYEVKMPTGEVRVYKVAQKDAASFATQMTIFGANLEQRKDEFAYKKQHDADTMAQAKERIGQEGQRIKLEEQRIVDAKSRGDKVDARDEQAVKERRLRLKAYIDANVFDKTQHAELIDELNK